MCGVLALLLYVIGIPILFYRMLRLAMKRAREADFTLLRLEREAAALEAQRGRLVDQAWSAEQARRASPIERIGSGREHGMAALGANAGAASDADETHVDARDALALPVDADVLVIEAVDVGGERPDSDHAGHRSQADPDPDAGVEAGSDRHAGAGAPEHGPGGDADEGEVLPVLDGESATDGDDEGGAHRGEGESKAGDASLEAGALPSAVAHRAEGSEVVAVGSLSIEEALARAGEQFDPELLPDVIALDKKLESVARAHKAALFELELIDAMCGCLYKRFQPDYPWWLLAQLLRKAALVTIFVMLTSRCANRRARGPRPPRSFQRALTLLAPAR